MAPYRRNDPRRSGGARVNGRLPNLLIIGAPRAGTTTLYEVLTGHPDIYMSANKEPWYYAAVDDPPYVGPGDGQGVRDPRAYRDLFAAAGDAAVVGEASTLYLASESAADRIAAELPGVRMIAMLRDPSERAFSAWLQHTWQARETLSFTEALDAGPERVAQSWAPFWDYRRMSTYGEQLAAYRKRFPEGDLKVCFFQDLVADGGSFFSEIYEFLGVADYTGAADDRQSNPAGMPKHPRVHAFLRGGSGLKRLGKKVIPDRLRRRLRRSIDSANMERPKIVPADRAKLVAYFEADIRRVEEMTGRDLSDWRS